MPARARIERQPLGVAGIISPWNYPVQLALVAGAGRARRRQSRAAEALRADAGDVRAAARPRCRGVSRDDEFAVVARRRGGRAGIQQPAFRSSLLHRFDGGRPAGGARRGGKSDAGDAGTRRQVAGAVRRRRRSRAGRTAPHGRQAPQRGTDVHRAGLRAGAGGEGRRIRGRGHERRRARLYPSFAAQSGLHVDRQRAPSAAPDRAARRRARKGRANRHAGPGGRRARSGITPDAARAGRRRQRHDGGDAGGDLRARSCRSRPTRRSTRRSRGSTRGRVRCVLLLRARRASVAAARCARRSPAA